ncbi:hypothetical protein [Maridesulfovibrio sp. FT414]|uniref:hypothetical protein n=1 Tax=Maridesulfovibrio sp. FT414 TaxID=2979469 RepID=UPI003D80386C
MSDEIKEQNETKIDPGPSVKHDMDIAPGTGFNWPGVFKGFVLVAWIVFLLVSASMACSGKVYTMLQDFPGKFKESLNGQTLTKGPEYYAKKLEGGSVWELLRSYDTVAPYPVILSVLNAAFPRWTEMEHLYENGCDGVVEVSGNYCSLFESVDKYLEAVVLTENLDPRNLSISYNVAPNVFKFAAEAEKVDFPEVAISWVMMMRAQKDKDKQLAKLTDSFFIMLVLGAFGSLVFLIKDFLYGEKRVRVAQYIFRPVLGMFLAMTVFLMDILTHSVLSTASVEELRLEPLYFLGIVSGMLAEQTYGVIYARAQKVIRKAAEDAGVTGV